MISNIIAIDTGNAMIKTPNSCFPAGVVHHGAFAPAIKGDVIHYGGQYYSLTSVRGPYMYDKTKDDTYYVLSLYTMVKELLTQYPDNDGHQLIERTVTLAMGLPPPHLLSLKRRYAEYFRKGGRRTEFWYNDQPFAITVSQVLVYSQGYAVIYDYIDRVRKEPQAYIIDVGGYTTDVIMLVNGKPDMSFCESFEYGTARLYSAIERRLRDQLNTSPDEIMIEALLFREDTWSAEARALAHQVAGQNAAQIVHSMQENGVKLKLALPIFIGGGSQTMRGHDRADGGRRRDAPAAVHRRHRGQREVL